MKSLFFRNFERPHYKTCSASCREGFDALLDETAARLKELPPIVHFAEEEPEEIRHSLDEFSVTEDGGVFVVEGPGIEMILDSVNFDDLDSLNWFHRTLKRIGVIDALREAGAGEGSIVRIDDMDFDFID